MVLRGGHPQHVVVGSGLPIGMFEDASYDLSEFEVQSGDRIVLVSDGLTEPFGSADDTLAAVGRLGLWPSVRNEVPDPEQLRARISSVLKESAPELRDDATALILHLTGSVEEVMRLAARPAAIPRAVRWIVDLTPTWADKVDVDLGLTEALTNAVLHGALGLSSTLRKEGDGYLDYLALAEELPDRPGFMDRHVELRAHTNPECFGVRISWEGSPCPPEVRHPKLDEFGLAESGMGMRLIYSLFHRVEWDDDGFGLELWLDRAPPNPSEAAAKDLRHD
jgi:anti-sigma regulatory factor (Ser/Thr protein kinase)